MLDRFQGLSLEHKQRLIKAIEMLNIDYSRVESEEAKLVIQKRIDELTIQLNRYKKPIFVFEDLNEGELYKYYLVDFTDDELMKLEEVVADIEKDIWKAESIMFHFKTNNFH